MATFIDSTVGRIGSGSYSICSGCAIRRVNSDCEQHCNAATLIISRIALLSTATVSSIAMP